MNKHDHRVNRIDVDIAIEILKSAADPEGIEACLRVAHLLEYVRDNRPDLVRTTIR